MNYVSDAPPKYTRASADNAQRGVRRGAWQVRTRSIANGPSVGDRLGQILGLELKRGSSDGVFWLSESVESVVDSGDVGVNVANSLGDGGTVTLGEQCWRGQGQDWQEGVGGEHGC